VSAERIVALLTARGETVAVAESLTGGLLAAELIAVPGASLAVRGAVVAYATELKHDLLGVDADLLAERGPVDGEVARQMAEGARTRLGSSGRPATYGIATTGVAGPDAQDGHAPGEVWLGLAKASGSRSERLDLTGDRAAIRRAAVEAALELLRRGIPE
jgi:nicotinamide-nucleotide amidase